MKKVALFLIIVLTFGACKKTKEKVATNLLLDIMTNGQWKMKNYIDKGTDITDSFSVFQFQFHKNNTVDAIKNNIEKTPGTWSGDINTATITANFPSSSYPINLINGSWLITDSGTDFVKARAISGTQINNTMWLEKL